MHIIKNSTYHYRKGYYGTYLSNDESNIGYVPIQKNASTYLTEFFKQNLGWTKEYNYLNDPKEKYIVVLRDPFQRWYAGVAQYLEYYHKYLDIDNEFILTFICQRVVLDAHTEPQVNFIEYLRVPKITFFRLNKDFDTNLYQYLSNNNLLNNNSNELELFKNKGSEMHTKVKVYDILERFLKKNPKYVHHIKNIYKADYDLINVVKFYGE